MSTDDVPAFKYNPDPFKLGVFVRETATCPCCEKSTGIVYRGPFYSRADVANLCPQCIRDGSAARKFSGEFHDPASCEEVDDAAYLDELVRRTPGYHGWQQEVWLSHCGDFCQILDTVGWDEIAPLENELRADIDRISDEFGISGNDFKQWLKRGGSFQGYLFQCLKCGHHRLHADSD